MAGSGVRRPAALLLLLYLTVSPAPSAGYGLLHLVDLQQVICDGGLGYYDVVIESSNIPQADKNMPHIVTFLRSVGNATTVSYQLMQGSTMTAVDGEHSVDLQAIGKRRLAELEQVLAEHEEEELELPQDEESDEAEAAELRQERRLSSRRRSMGSRSRTSSSSSSKSWFSPSPSSSIGSTSPRRRSAVSTSPSARRRGAATYTETTARRRTTAVTPPAGGSTRFATSSGSGYGYTSAPTMQANYGGNYPAYSPYYGYSGYSSYGPGRQYGTSTVVTSFAVGAVAGASTYYMLSRLSYMSCAGYLCCYGCNNACYRRVNSYSDNYYGQCKVQMNRQLVRDDIMISGAGFYPNDYTFPLRIRITGVEGPAYDPDFICPDTNATKNGTNSTIQLAAAAPPDLYVTLTMMDELGDLEGDASGSKRACSATLGVAAACAVAAAGTAAP